MLLLSRLPRSHPLAGEPCLVLNKRSPSVRQAGDLCCPGGALAPHIDPIGACLLKLPHSPLQRWPHWRWWRRRFPRAAAELSLLLATSLRESLEEMRLNPIAVTFLGPLPKQELVLFKRHIYPMVGWVDGWQRFKPNWEVARIVYLPLRHLLDPSRYCRYRLVIANRCQDSPIDAAEPFPAFQHYGRNGAREILWGATYRIVRSFLQRVFDFEPPPLMDLPLVEGFRRKSYLGLNR
jgi:hypothetical protein